jgi:hypothetical protein
VKKREENGNCFFFGELPLCGCGCPDAVLELIKGALENAAAFPDGPEPHKSMPDYFGGDDPIHWLATYALDKAGLIEHGSNVRWSWLTDKGHVTLNYLRDYGCEPDAWPDDEPIEWEE